MNDHFLLIISRLFAVAMNTPIVHWMPTAWEHVSEVNFYGSQINRVSDAISVKRGELLRIKDLLQSRLGTSDIATKYHYKDMILRINTALGI